MRHSYKIITALTLCLAVIPASFGKASADTPFRVEGSVPADSVANLATWVDITDLDLSDAVITDSSLGAYVAAGTIPEAIFFGSSLRSITLPRSTVSIAASAFAGSDIEEITVPDGVTVIGDYAFYGCRALRSVTLPATLRSIGRYAFGGCTALTSLELGHTRVTLLPEGLLSATVSLKEFASARITEVGSHVFKGSGVETLSLPGARLLADYALAGAPNLRSVTLPDRVPAGRGVLMDNPSLNELNGQLAEIPDYFAANSGDFLSEGYILADRIGDYAFANMTTDTLVLGGSLSEVSYGFLSGCDGLSVIDVRALADRIPHAEESALSGIDPASIRLAVIPDCKGLWSADPVWGAFEVYADPRPLGVEEVTQAGRCESVSIRFQGNHIIVTAPEPLTSLTVYDTSGAAVWRVTPGAEEYEISPEDLPGGVLILVARAGNEVKSMKFYGKE